MKQYKILDKLIKQFTPEFQLILASADGDIFKTKELLRHSINWEIFMKLAFQHRVYPLVYKTLRQLIQTDIPKHVLVFLQEKCKDNSKRALKITGETVRVTAFLEKNKIYPIVLKGAPLSWRLYRDITVRPYSDIDMLIPFYHLKKSENILEQEGYRKLHSEHVLESRQLQIFLKAHHHGSHFMYWNINKGVLLEIHWRLSTHGHVLPLPAGNINKVRMAGSLLPVLSDDEWLLYLIIHGAGHGWKRFRWLIDIKMLIEEGNTDWVNLDCLAKKFGIQIFLHMALILISVIFALPIPRSLESAVRVDTIAWRLAYLTLKVHLDADYNAKKSKWIYSLVLSNYYHFYITKGLINKVNYILRLFGPTVEDIKLVSFPEKLYVLYYIIHPFTFLGRSLHRLIIRS